MTFGIARLLEGISSVGVITPALSAHTTLLEEGGVARCAPFAGRDGPPYVISLTPAGQAALAKSESAARDA